ncbi:Tryptophan halogenase [Sphingomonas sp. EC-HK361]|uniref:tryptophan halogenase family protein n=1 Tax=Sphingomonas sp. EC-HK361 TaxID=2038397 RepID=UPI00125267D6|nr:tryptophan halogenase family protein [Sphingomonas sp. EC-HK361]VVS96453.1 Tryptophan halogenase [Sphingomonas sp. EC-HK361]
MQRVRRVVILGGGTAGWMTAAALGATLGQTVSISLLESDAIGTVGVGEATIPTIHWFNQLIGLDEADFVRETKASFKLGIEFVDWTRPGHRYFHPFGRYGVDLGAVPFHQRWLRARADGHDRPLSAYSLAAQLAEAGGFARPSNDPGSILSTLGYAYHFDAGLYARYLRSLAEARGVTRYEGRLEQVEHDANSGVITALTTERGERLSGDLFIDCSGFRALLIGDEMGSPFEDWSHWLPCDRAVAVPCARVAETTPFTRSTLRPAGWQWRIPLQHRTGNGYVYASRFVSDDEAAATLLANLDGEALAEPRMLRFQAGFRREAWRGNVVAIGLSSGFLEPLESTSIHLIQSAIAKLITLFPDADCDPALARQFNALFGRDMDGIRDFLILHYHATTGHHHPLWQHTRTMALPDTLIEKEAHYARSGRVMLSSDELFREASWLAVLNGQGIVAAGPAPIADTLDGAANRRQLDQIEAVIARAVPTLPRHDDAIAALLGESGARASVHG